jgi:AcrR family transcriptional regulator
MPLPAKPPARPAARKRKPASAPYHHGNLREALLEAGLELLRDHGAEALGLRELARQAGVSRTAPYRHFENKEALIAAIAEQGFLRLQAYLDEAHTREGRDIERWFLEAGRQYIRFAAENPENIKVMFGPYITYDPQLHAHLHAVGEATFGRLVELVVHAQQAGLVRGGDPVNVSLSVWSLVHGFAMLLVHNRLDFLQLDAARIAALGEQAAHDALAAVRAAPPGRRK